MTDAVLVGANLVALVAATELAAAGRRVVLLTDGQPPGGHFRGLVAEGIAFDTGMVTLERPGARNGPAPALSGYDPDQRYDWTRFGALVDRWQAGRADLRRTPTPQVLVGGRRFPDHLMSDRLDILDGVVPPAPLLQRSDPRHAMGKTTTAAYDALTYRDVAAANHGADAQTRLVDPFVHKVLGPAADDLLARHHRAAWLPLYWPETVAAASRGEPTAVPEHPFWTTGSGLVADLVAGLLAEVTASSRVTVDDGVVRSVERHGDVRVTTDGGTWQHPSPALGVAVGRARELAGLPPLPAGPAAPVTVLCCLVRSEAVRDRVGCLLVADGGLVSYRVTDQDAQAGRDTVWSRVTVETGAAGQALADSGADLARRLVEELVGLLGLPSAAVGPGGTGHPDVRVLRVVTARRALVVPTARTVAADRRSRDDLAAVGLLPTGGLLGTGLNSLADQVVQGLALAERLG